MLRARGIESFDVRLRAGPGWAELRAHHPIQLDADLRQVDWPSSSEFLACVFAVLVLMLFWCWWSCSCCDGAGSGRFGAHSMTIQLAGPRVSLRDALADLTAISSGTYTAAGGGADPSTGAGGLQAGSGGGSSVQNTHNLR